MNSVLSSSMKTSCPQKKYPQKALAATIDLGAHSVRMLIAEYETISGKTSPLEDLEVAVPLGSSVFRHGKISNAVIRMLCDIFKNFRSKMDEYGITQYRAIATSAAREASNSDILLERIYHATGIRVTIFEGSDEARLDYFTVMDTVPAKYRFSSGNALIANIGTGACQVSAYDSGKLHFTETIKIGTLRVLELMPDTMSASGVRKYLTPIVNKSFSEIQNLAERVHSRLLIAMGSSVRSLLALSGKDFSKSRTAELSASDFDLLMKHLTDLTFEDISSRYGMEKDLSEAVIPCALIISNLFRITGAQKLLVPMISTKDVLMQDFIQGLTGSKDRFAQQIENIIKTTAEKYHTDAAYGELTWSLAEKLFRQLIPLHGLKNEDLILLRIAALLHKSGMFINNQAYHKHSFYIISNTEIPGIVDSDRKVAALTARYHRKSFPGLQHAEFAALTPDNRTRVLKLSAILRIACALAQGNASPDKLKISWRPDKVILSSSQYASLQDLFPDESVQECFSRVFAVPLLFK